LSDYWNDYCSYYWYDYEYDYDYDYNYDWSDYYDDNTWDYDEDNYDIEAIIEEMLNMSALEVFSDMPDDIDIKDCFKC
jgi:hypothetical protein